MISIKFQGWFQSRLATDPDPVDEPRGVSGYMKSLPGEPDFDRIIRFHNPSVVRSHTPNVGVFVTKIFNDNEDLKNHPLIGARFNLEGDPKYYGYNGIISDDGDEPIVPIIISLTDGDFKLQRGLFDKEPIYPFKEFMPKNGIVGGSNDIGDVTGIWNALEIVNSRIKLLEADLLVASDEITKYNINERLKFLKSTDKDGVRIAIKFFNARMMWNVSLIGSLVQENNIYFAIEPDDKWGLNFWMGAWDPDAQNGYVSGIIKMPKTTLK